MSSNTRPLLPRTFWRFFLPTLCVVAIAFVAATVITYFTGISGFTAIHGRNATSLLASAVTGYRHTQADIDDFRAARFTQQRELLREALGTVQSTCALYEDLARSGRLDEAEAKRLALRSAFSRDKAPGEPIVLAAREKGDGTYELLGSTPRLDNTPNALLDTLSALLDNPQPQKDGAAPYVFATSTFSTQERMSPHLASAARISPWGWLIVAGVSMDAYKLAVADNEASAMKNFNEYLMQITSDLGGELTIFGEQCEVTATSVEDASQHTLSDGVWMNECHSMIAAATEGGSLQHPAEGSFGKTARSKRGSVFWAVRVPSANLYAAFILPRALLARSAVRFVDTLTITGISAIIVLGLALTVLLAGLLRPVSALSDAYRRVMSGDFTVRADEHISGEIGDLCRQFNAMARSLQELMQTEQLRQVELDEINKTLEQQVRIRTEALANKAKELEGANLRLQEMDQLKTNFLQSVSHELRTPLTSVLGFAKLIHKDFSKYFASFGEGDPVLGERGSRVKRNLEIIISEGERLTRLINEVLDLAKIESGRMTWNDDIIDMSRLLSSVAVTFRSRSAESGVSLALDIPAALPHVVGDSDRLTQVMVNLLDNAFKFTSEGEVRLNAWLENGRLMVEVKDTGIGIPPEDLDMIFDKFHQTSRRDTLKDKPPGTGLGLAICRQIVLRHGGSISAASSLSEGTAITFSLPMDPESEDRQG